MFSLKSIKRYFSKLIKILSLKELRILPAYLSYSFVLAVIPIATIIVIVAGYFSISIDSIINLINEFLPSYASDIVVGVISGKDFDISVGVFRGGKLRIQGDRDHFPGIIIQSLHGGGTGLNTIAIGI